jgi:hypothetical protein
MRSIFRFYAEKAEVVDWLAERSRFELSGDFMSGLTSHQILSMRYDSARFRLSECINHHSHFSY